MIADRHIHMTPAQAAAFGLADGDRVQVKIDGPKPGVMGGGADPRKRQMCTGFSHRHGRWQCLPAQAGAAGHRAGQRGVSYDFRDRQGDRLVATRKMPELVGYKFLLVEPVFGSKKDTIVAGDNIGAGVGEMVLVTTDETTQHGLDHPSPIDAFIVGIVDNPPTLSK